WSLWGLMRATIALTDSSVPELRVGMPAVRGAAAADRTPPPRESPLSSVMGGGSDRLSGASRHDLRLFLEGEVWDGEVVVLEARVRPGGLAEVRVTHLAHPTP